MEAVDISLALIKALGIIAAAGFAVLGVLTEFRDKTTQQLTRWGRVAVFGAAVSAVLSLTITGFEGWKLQSESRASAARL
jgi:hypothetical protein